MRITFVINSLGSGGAERQITNLAVQLKKVGHEVRFLTYRDETHFKPLLDENNITIKLIESNGKYDAIFKTRRILRKNEQDVVIAFLRSPILCCCAAALPNKKWKLITSLRCAQKNYFYTRYGKLLSYMTKYADLIVCNSNKEKILWDQYVTKNKGKTSVIYNMVIPGKVYSQYIPRKNNKLNIVVAASYSDIKNIKGVLAALCLMSEEERYKFHIEWYGHKEIAIGDTTVYEQAATIIEENSLQEVITLNDATHEIADKMHQADAIGLFSRFEGLPNAICEGMMLGKPIIMTRVSDFDTLVDENNGLLCDADDPESIKYSLMKLSNISVDMLTQMGQVSKKRAETLFRIDNVLKQWTELLS